MKKASDREYGKKLQQFYHSNPQLIEESLATYFLYCKRQQG
jgi:hypothetical protein